MRILFFDTETTGVPANYKASYTDVNNWPRLVQLGYIVYDNGIEIISEECIIKPEGFVIPEQASKIHGITQEMAEKGISLSAALYNFNKELESAELLIGHNISFDLSILGCEYFRLTQANPLVGKSTYCTMLKSADLLKLPGRSWYKWPKLKELYQFLFNEPLAQTHTALDDIRQTAKCYFELQKRGVL